LLLLIVSTFVCYTQTEQWLPEEGNDSVQTTATDGGDVGCWFVVALSRRRAAGGSLLGYLGSGAPEEEEGPGPRPPGGPRDIGHFLDLSHYY
jgi:hypothetical protein